MISEPKIAPRIRGRHAHIQVSSSGLSRGPSDQHNLALADGWMAGTSPAMTARGEADRIRDELAAMGIQLRDAKDPATGEIVTTWR